MRIVLYVHCATALDSNVPWCSKHVSRSRVKSEGRSEVRCLLPYVFITVGYRRLHQTGSIHHHQQLKHHNLLSLVTSLVLTRLDYGSATVLGVLDRVHSVLSASLHCFAIRFIHQLANA